MQHSRDQPTGWGLGSLVNVMTYRLLSYTAMLLLRFWVFFLIEKQNIFLVEGLIIWNMEVKLKPRLIITVPGFCYLLSAFTLMCVYRESFYSHKLFPDEMCSKIGEECFLRNVYDSNENACIPKTK